MDGWRYASDFKDFVEHFFMEVYLESIQMVKQIFLFEFHFQRQPKPSLFSSGPTPNAVLVPLCCCQVSVNNEVPMHFLQA